MGLASPSSPIGGISGYVCLVRASLWYRRPTAVPGLTGNMLVTSLKETFEVLEVSADFSVLNTSKLWDKPQQSS